MPMKIEMGMEELFSGSGGFGGAFMSQSSRCAEPPIFTVDHCLQYRQKKRKT